MKNILYLSFTLILLGFSQKGFSQNMISNGNFESDFTDWQNLISSPGVGTYSIGTGTDAQEGSKAMKAVITTAGTNAWDIQSIHAGWASKNGTAYTLTLYAKASTAGLKVRLVQQNSTYASTEITLTTTYTKYTWSFTAQEDGLKFRLNFPQAGTFYIDNVYIADPSSPTAGVAKVNIDVTKKHQTMEGFGGALTWYSDWIKYGSTQKQTEIYNLLFSDLGLDILRLKNWYFPQDYPTNKAVSNIASGNLTSYNNTLEFYKKAKAANSNVDVLLCSWTPPTYLKSNNNPNEGTLKKNNNQFMYKEFGQYWVDLMSALNTNGVYPDYISIQNEPGFVNSGWETCEWRPTETTDYPSYGTAFDTVYNRLNKLSSMSKMIGPEVENIGTDSDIGQNTFTGYTTPLKGKTGLTNYAYHLYNFGGSNEASIMSSGTATTLNNVRDNFGDKPNFMTEFGTLTWFNAACMIHQTLTQANASAYIHWELVWQDNDETMLALDNSGNYTIKPMYYTVKHFAKYIDKGYQRIDVASDNAYLTISGYKNPSSNTITLVAINRAPGTINTTLDLGSLNIVSSEVYQSMDSSYFQSATAILNKQLSIPKRSISTIVINYTDVTTAVNTSDRENGTFTIYPNPVKELLVINCKSLNKNIDAGVSSSSSDYSIGMYRELVITDYLGQIVLTQQLNSQEKTIDISQLKSGIYFIKVGSDVKKFVKE